MEVDLDFVLMGTAAKTQHAYRDYWSRWVRWCDSNAQSAFPADPRVLARWLTEQRAAGQGASAVKLMAASVGRVHTSYDLPSPVKATCVKRAKRAAEQESPPPRQARALDTKAWTHLRQAVETSIRPGAVLLTEQRRVYTRLLALVAFMRDSMTRESEAMRAQWSNIRIERHPDGGRYGVLRVPHPKGRKGEARRYLSDDTLELLKRYRRLKQKPFEPVIFNFSRADYLGMSIGDGCLRFGLGSGFTGHSPRVGMAQDLARAGESVAAIQQAGGWKEPKMVAYYIRDITAGDSPVARLHRNALRYPPLHVRPLPSPDPED